MSTIDTEQKYKNWDKFIAELMLCHIAAQNRYKYFMIMDIDPKDVYDLLFHRIAIYANQFTKCKVYTSPYHFFKFLLFKLKERQAHYPFLNARRYINSSYTHLCSHAERIKLIEEVAEQNNFNLEDLPLLYKEYYSR